MISSDASLYVSHYLIIGSKPSAVSNSIMNEGQYPHSGDANGRVVKSLSKLKCLNFPIDRIKSNSFVNHNYAKINSVYDQNQSPKGGISRL